MSEQTAVVHELSAQLQALRDERDRYLTALKAWMIYYEQHSTSENRERAYNLTQAALTPAGGGQDEK